VARSNFGKEIKLTYLENGQKRAKGPNENFGVKKCYLVHEKRKC